MTCIIYFFLRITNTYIYSENIGQSSILKRYVIVTSSCWRWSNLKQASHAYICMFVFCGWMDWNLEGICRAAVMGLGELDISSNKLKPAWPGRQAGLDLFSSLPCLGGGTDNRFFLLPFLIALLSISIYLFFVAIRSLPPFNGHKIPLAMVVQVNKNCSEGN